MIVALMALANLLRIALSSFHTPNTKYSSGFSGCCFNGHTFDPHQKFSRHTRGVNCGLSRMALRLWPASVSCLPGPALSALPATCLTALVRATTSRCATGDLLPPGLHTPAYTEPLGAAAPTGDLRPVVPMCLGKRSRPLPPTPNTWAVSWG
jgi:hypothetical protein